MKLMIASDIHGSAAYCRDMLEAFKNEAPDKLLLLGDLLNHGPRNALPLEYDPPQVIDMLNSIKNDLLCVRGNCDSEVDQMILDFPIMADYCILHINGRTVFATHGHHFNDTNLPPLKKDDILLCGHTHIPACRETDGVLYLNPGSVSIPKENSHHGYMLLGNNLAIWKDFDKNIIRKEKI